MYKERIRNYFKKYINKTFHNKDSIKSYLLSHPGLEKMCVGLNGEFIEAASRNINLLKGDLIKDLSEQTCRAFCVAALNNKEKELKSNFTKELDLSNDKDVQRALKEKQRKEDLKDKNWEQLLENKSKREFVKKPVVDFGNRKAEKV